MENCACWVPAGIADKATHGNTSLNFVSKIEVNIFGGMDRGCKPVNIVNGHFIRNDSVIEKLFEHVKIVRGEICDFMQKLVKDIDARLVRGVSYITFKTWTPMRFNFCRGHVVIDRLKLQPEMKLEN